jgi:uncharacterized protein with ATP-grasp and redox domains
MQLQPDCISCILTMSVSLMRKLRLPEPTVRALTVEILGLPALTGRQWDTTSPEVIEMIMTKIVSAVGDPDPFFSIKTALNRAMMDRYGFFEDVVENAEDPLFTAAKLAIAGNAIDFMVPNGTTDLEAAVMAKLEAPLSRESFDRFGDKIASSTSVVVLGDNAGEIVLDKLFVETVRRRYPLDVVYVVRSVPTLNDATIHEAAAVGMDRAVRVVENGIDGPLPGTIPRRCAAEVRRLMDRADLIIAKGGGNFDCLSEANPYRRKTVFMLLSKCYPLNRYFQTPPFHPILSSASAKAPEC